MVPVKELKNVGYVLQEARITTTDLEYANMYAHPPITMNTHLEL